MKEKRSASRVRPDPGWRPKHIRFLPDRKRSALLAVIVSLLLAGLFGLRYAVNNLLLPARYAAGDHRSTAEEMLLTASFPESVVPEYNVGCLKYRQGRYDEAAAYFERALKKRHSEEQDCSIRINLSLSRLREVDLTGIEEDEEKKNLVIGTLRDARALLTENGCAEEAADRHNGHSEEAERLKADIDRMLEKLDPAGEAEDPGEDPEKDTDADGQDSHSGHKPSALEKKLEKQKEEARQEREKERMDAEKRAAEMLSGGQENAGAGEDQNGEGGQYRKSW